MKKMLCGMLFSLSFLMGRSQDQELQQLILDVEKLAQFKQILVDMKEGYEILTKGYEAVRAISQGNFDLHKVFLDGLLEVSPFVRNYYKIAGIVSNELALVKEYKMAYRRIVSSGYFNAGEISYVAGVYSKLFDESIKNLSDLTTILTAGTARMSDAERLAGIDRLDKDMSDKLAFLRYFNNQAAIMTLQRAKERSDSRSVQKMYELNP